jgi:hypothetical protein
MKEIIITPLKKILEKYVEKILLKNRILKKKLK